MSDRKEFVCDDCDWIGSPRDEPDECPNCGSVNLTETDLAGADDDASGAAREPRA